MRSFLVPAAICTTLLASAQYGSFDASAVKNAKAHTTIVVLDNGDTPYNRAIMDAVQAEWKFSGGHEFVKIGDLAMRPVTPDMTYLLKTAKTDPVKHEGTFLTLVQGWKPKKGESLEQKEDAFTNIPAQQELAFILIDPKAINDGGATAMVGLYVRHLQDYLKQVETGKITDKTTADRIYSGRTRHIRDQELWLGREHLDKTLPEMASVKEVYTTGVDIKPVPELMKAVEKQDRNVAITDVVITGDHKTKHCFKRVFNAGTGELMYQKDEASLHGKKEGFLDEDLKTIARAR